MIRLSDTDVVRFKPEVSPDSSIIYPFEMISTKVRFSPAEGTQGSLKALGVGSEVRYANGLLTTPDSDVYSPARFEYTRPDGTVYVISTENGIESMTDAGGNTVTYEENGITHSSGAGIGFERDTSGKIRTVTDSYGRKTEYVYDGNGMLTQVRQLGGESGFGQMLSNYAYKNGIADRPVIKEIKAPDGTVLGTFEYDTGGRMKDAGGKRIIYGFDLPNHKQNVTDRRGHVTKYEYDGEGNVTRKEDPLGNVTVWAYDDDGNKVSETNPLGHTTAWTYDGNGNMLTEADPLGNTTSYTYNERNHALTVADPLGNMTENAYDDKGNFEKTTDASGKETDYTYDSHGSLKSVSEGSEKTTYYDYDDDGNLIRETGPSGAVTTRTYDRDGNERTVTVTRTAGDGSVVTMTTENRYDALSRVVRAADADEFFTLTEYGQVTGKQSVVTDKRGNSTVYEYDGAGNAKKITYPDSTTETFTYDGEGNRLTFTDRADRTTEYAYDELSRLVRTTYPDTAYTLTEYDAAGRVAFTGDENRNRTMFTHDAAGRRTEVTDALGNVTKFGYDAAGNQVSMTDAGGRTVTFEYDALNRRVRTVYSDGSFTKTEYSECCGQKASDTDQGGKVTRFEYDASGRLTDVIQVAEGQEIGTSYEYDEVGNRRFQTDPNANITEWEHDNLGRVTERTLPLGMSESFVHDPNGNVTEKTDFNDDKIVYEYDENNRPVSKTYPDESVVSFTYTPTGQRKTVTDSRGTTAYAYDLRDRVKEVTNPDGTVISYAYDAAGNRTSVTVPSGTTTYTYDVLNRLKTVTDPDNGVTTYTYDKVGNRKSVTYPNGTVAEYMYDRLNRLIKLENRTSADDLISGYIYTLGPAGNRQKAEELHSGRVVSYIYDDLYRLTEENVTDPVLGNEVISYTYDSFGNRLEKTDSSGTVSYSYDDNDRLISEGNVTYTYDDNGNMLTKSDGTDTVFYNYDYENRLVFVQGPDGTTEYAYDADGIRVRSVTDGVVTNYLVDKNRAYAQVLEERDGSGSLTVSYVYGDALISQKRGGSVSYHHFDGLGSTRALTGASGNVTDTYTYEAFGGLIDHIGNTVNNYLFTTAQYDPNAGFYYLRARYYSPGNGRFLTQDPWKGNIYDPQSLHKYAYAHLDPVSRTDPSGLMSLGELDVTQVLMRQMSHVITTGSRLLRIYDKANSVKDVIMGIINIIDFVGNVSHFQGAFPRSGVKPDFKFSGAADSFLSLAKQGMAKGAANWSAGYLGSRIRGQRLKAYILYMPTFFRTPQRTSRIGSVNGIPLKLGFGVPDKKGAGTLMGIGVEMGGERQLLRMDLGPKPKGHGDKDYEIDVIEDAMCHMHVIKWNGLVKK